MQEAIQSDSQKASLAKEIHRGAVLKNPKPRGLN